MRPWQAACGGAARYERICRPQAFWIGTSERCSKHRHFPGRPFDLAYNAAHALSLAALRWHGYRAGNRYIVFQVLPHTLALGPEVWRVLAKCHDIRNLGEYEGDLNVDDRIVTDLIAACQVVASKLGGLPPPHTSG